MLALKYLLAKERRWSGPLLLTAAFCFAGLMFVPFLPLRVAQWVEGVGAPNKVKLVMALVFTTIATFYVTYEIVAAYLPKVWRVGIPSAIAVFATLVVGGSAFDVVIDPFFAAPATKFMMKDLFELATYPPSIFAEDVVAMTKERSLLFDGLSWVIIWGGSLLLSLRVARHGMKWLPAWILWMVGASISCYSLSLGVGHLRFFAALAEPFMGTLGGRDILYPVAALVVGVLHALYARKRVPTSQWVVINLMVLVMALFLAGRFDFTGAGLIAYGPNAVWWPAAAIGLLGLGAYWLSIAIIRYYHSFYTTVSIAGLAFGTMCLVLILGVMGGFEGDLQGKILGVKAHMRVERIGEPFDNYREVGKTLEGISGVVAQSPFYETEAVIAFEKNPASVIVRGIDPQKSGAVVNLAKRLKEGSLDHLYPLSADGEVVGPPGKKSATDAPTIDDTPMDFSSEADVAEAEDEEVDSPDAFPEMPPEFQEDSEFEQVRTNTLDGILIGQELYNQHEVFQGKRITLVSPLSDVSPAGGGVPTPYHREYRMAGHFYIGMVQFDLKYVYVTLESIHQFLNLDDIVTGIELRVSDPDDTGAVKSRIQKALGPEYRVQDWKEVDRALFSALQLEKKTMFVVLILAILVAAFSVLGNLIMVVVEKGREIAILKAMGVTHGGIWRVFGIQGLEIGILGGLIGVCLGSAICVVGQGRIPIPAEVWYISILPVEVSFSASALTFLVAVCASALATIYPAWLAASLPPVRGLKAKQ